MSYLVIFIIGAMIGTSFGFLLAAMCRVSAQSDHDIMREEAEQEQSAMVSDVELQPRQENDVAGFLAIDTARSLEREGKR